MSENTVAEVEKTGDRDENGHFLPGNATKAPTITRATAHAMQEKSVISRRQGALDAIRDAFVDGEDIWQHGVEKAARVLVDMVSAKGRKVADRDKIMAFRELTKHLTAETSVELEDQDGRRVKAGSIEELEAVLALIKAQKEGKQA